MMHYLANELPQESICW